jgi:hypothetical protein
LGFSLNFPLSAPAACAGGDAAFPVAAEADSVAPGAEGVTGAGGVAKSGGEGAITCGFVIDGGTIESVNKTGVPTGADAGSVETTAGSDGVASNFGLNRIFGTVGGSAGSGAAGASVNAGGGAAVKEGFARWTANQ